MKRCIVLGLVLLMAAPAFAQADVSKFLGDLAGKYSGSLAVVKYTIDMETGARTVMGQGICVSNDQGLGVFMTTALDPRMNVESVKDFQVIAPGVGGKTVKAKLQGIDPWTGLGFVQATEKGEWQAVQFARTSGLKLGQMVGSVGIMMGDPAHPVYVGAAYVSALMRVPGDLAYVAGGRLTSTCSPVFTADGKAIGIVGRQLMLSYQMPTQQGMVNMELRSQQETAFFTPVEEFINVVDSHPTDGKTARLPWMGINRFEAVNPELLLLLKLDKPAVVIEEVIPGEPAAKAGLSSKDIIIELNGKPLEKLATPDLSVRNFVRDLMRMKAGDTIDLKVLSGLKSKDVKVTLGAMPTRPDEAPRSFIKALGLLVREKVALDEFLDKGPTAAVPGLVALGVVQNSPAAAAGIQGGDLITNVNNQPVKTKEAYEQIVNKSLEASRTAPINFLVRRGEQAQVITVKPGT